VVRSAVSVYPLLLLPIVHISLNAVLSQFYFSLDDATLRLISIDLKGSLSVIVVINVAIELVKEVIKYIYQ
jgi:hypothetical protein